MNSKVSHAPTRAEIDTELAIVDYVAGRLTGSERSAFEKRLASDPDLAARVEEERELSVVLRGTRDHGIPPAEAFEKIRPELTATRLTAGWFAAVAASLVAVVVVLVFMQPPEPAFETLSSDQAQRVDTSNRFRVVFSAASDETDRASAAEEFAFDIVSGPGPGGAFVVKTEKELSREQLFEWRDDPRIDLAEPVSYETDL